MMAAEPVSGRRERAADLASERAERAPVYRAERIEDAARLLDLVAGPKTTATAFQTAAWLAPLYDVLLPSLGGQALGIAVRDARSGELALVLPLVVVREGHFRIARFADLGVSDYRAPVLGPAAPTDAAGAAALWPAVLSALDGIDLIDLTQMPPDIAGRPNPLAILRLAQRARHSRHVMAVPGTVEDFIRSCGRKYRKEVERSLRVLAKEGAVEFRRAETTDEIGRAFAALEAQQGARRRELGGDYALDRPEYSRFYATLLAQGTRGGFAHIFTLSCRGEMVATLLGVVHDGVFTLLRIANAGERWRHVSPGRLIIVEAMRYFAARGVRAFDVGIGSYPFKERFGADETPLFDLVAPLTWKGVPRSVAARAKARLRQSPRFMALIARLRGHH